MAFLLKRVIVEFCTSDFKTIKNKIFHKKFRGPLPPPRGSIILVFFVEKNEQRLALPEMERQLNKIPLVPMGFLTPGSAYA